MTLTAFGSLWCSWAAVTCLNPPGYLWGKKTSSVQHTKWSILAFYRNLSDDMRPLISETSLGVR